MYNTLPAWAAYFILFSSGEGRLHSITSDAPEGTHCIKATYAGSLSHFLSQTWASCFFFKFAASLSIFLAPSLLDSSTNFTKGPLRACHIRSGEVSQRKERTLTISLQLKCQLQPEYLPQGGVPHVKVDFRSWISLSLETKGGDDTLLRSLPKVSWRI